MKIGYSRLRNIICMRFNNRLVFKFPILPFFSLKFVILRIYD